MQIIIQDLTKALTELDKMNKENVNDSWLEYVYDLVETARDNLIEKQNNNQQ